MVVTGAPRKRLVRKGTWVRIPPSPPTPSLSAQSLALRVVFLLAARFLKARQRHRIPPSPPALLFRTLRASARKPSLARRLPPVAFAKADLRNWYDLRAQCLHRSGRPIQQLLDRDEHQRRSLGPFVMGQSIAGSRAMAERLKRFVVHPTKRCCPAGDIRQSDDK